MDNLDFSKLRARIEHEDKLLNQRTAIFLTANGLGAVAIGLNTLEKADILLVVVASVVNILWLLCGIQNVLVLKNLTTEYIQNSKDAIDAIVRKSTICIPLAFNPSNILGIYLPLVVLAAWLVGFVYLDIPLPR